MYFMPDVLQLDRPPAWSIGCAPDDFLTIAIEDRAYRVKRRFLVDVVLVPERKPTIAVGSDCRQSVVTASRFTLVNPTMADGVDGRLPTYVMISRRVGPPPKGEAEPHIPDEAGPPTRLASGILSFNGRYYVWPRGQSPAQDGALIVLYCNFPTLGPSRTCTAPYTSADGESLWYRFSSNSIDPDDWPSLDARVRQFVTSIRVPLP